MDRAATEDAAQALDAYAAKQGWPFRVSSELIFIRSELNLLRDLWFETAAGGAVPYRRNFDARTLKPVLRNIAIIESVDGCGRRRWRIRLLGTEIAGLFGDSTGKHLDETIPAALLPRWEIPCNAVLDAGSPFRFVSNYDHPRVNYLSGESLMAPMLDAHGNSTMLLCCTYFRRTKEPLNPPG